MIGAIAGDIIGSRFEFDNYKNKNFDLFEKECSLTDDSIMTIAVGKALINSCNTDELSINAVKWMQEIGRKYPLCGYGARFFSWLYSDDPKPYNSCGNGSAMRCCACGEIGKTLEEVKTLSEAVTAVTHDHPEGIKGAEATSVAVYMALRGSNKDQIEQEMMKYYPRIGDSQFCVDMIREKYKFYEICQETVPQAVQCFLESTDFEDAVRNAVSIGGDSDTVACITGAIAGAYYGVPDHIAKKCVELMDDYLKSIYLEYVKLVGEKII